MAISLSCNGINLLDPAVARQSVERSEVQHSTVSGNTSSAVTAQQSCSRKVLCVDGEVRWTAVSQWAVGDYALHETSHRLTASSRSPVAANGNPPSTMQSHAHSSLLHTLLLTVIVATSNPVSRPSLLPALLTRPVPPSLDSVLLFLNYLLHEPLAETYWASGYLIPGIQSDNQIVV